MTTPSPAAPKRSWPLVALAATSFIPVFGFFLAAIAVSWGLLSDRPRARLAIGLGAVGALFQIVVGLAGYLATKDTQAMHAAQAQVARNDLAAIARELEIWRAGHQRYPATLQELTDFRIPTRVINTTDLSAGFLHLQPYHYRTTNSGSSYTLFAVGPDGVAETPDDIHPPAADSSGTVESSD